MKKVNVNTSRIKRVAILGILFLLAISSMGMFFTDNVSTVATIILTNNSTGVIEGYDYEFWTDVNKGSPENKAMMILTGGGSFISDYDTSNNKNTLMRTGKKIYSRKTHNQVGEITIT